MLMVLVVTCNCGFTDNRRNKRKSTLKSGGNSPKADDDPIGQVFAFVIAGSKGFQWFAVFWCFRSGWSEKRPSVIHDSASFEYFFKFLAPTVRIPLFICLWHKEQWKSSCRDVIHADLPEKSKESKEMKIILIIFFLLPLDYNWFW